MSLTLGQIFASYDKAKKMLKKAELLFDEDLRKSRSLKKKDFSKAFKEISSTNNYRQIYEVARDNSDYNLLLKNDGSFFQFGYDNIFEDQFNLRYSYFESPVNIQSYENFLLEHDLDFKECGHAFSEEYTQFIAEAESKDHFTSIRYDLDFHLYEEVKHPASHIHIGLDNDIRLPCSSILTPQSFVAFIIKHVYWEKWVKISESNESFLEEYLDTFKNMKSLHENYFNESDRSELFITGYQRNI